MSWFTNAVGLDKKKEKAAVAAKAAAAREAADPYSLTNQTKTFQGAQSQAHTYSNTANDAYLRQATSFDPSRSVLDYSKVAYDQTSQNIRKQLADLAGRSAGQGRLNTGFYDEDQGEVMTQNLADYNSKVAGAATNATGLQLQNMQGLANFGANQQNMFVDMVQSERERLYNDAREKAERDRQKKRGIGGLIGTALGATIGSFIPGIGTAAGASLGGSLGGKL